MHKLVLCYGPVIVESVILLDKCFDNAVLTQEVVRVYPSLDSDDREFTNKRKVTIPVPKLSSIESIKERLAKHPTSTIYRIQSNDVKDVLHKDIKDSLSKKQLRQMKRKYKIMRFTKNDKLKEMKPRAYSNYGFSITFMLDIDLINTCKK